MAMPTCACASAGASLMPSPAIATMRPSPCSRLTTSALLLGQHFGDRPRRCRACAATASAVVRLSPVSMTIAQPSVVQLPDRLGRGRLDRIGDAEQPGELAVDGDEHHRLPVARAAPRPSGEQRQRRCRSSSKSARLPSATARPSTLPATPLPGDATGSPRPGASAMPRSSRACDDGGRQRMLAAALQARGQAQQLALRRSPAAGSTATSCGLPSVSVPVLSTTSVSTLSQQLRAPRHS